MLNQRPASPEPSESEDSDSSQKNRRGDGAKDAFGPAQDFQGLDLITCHIIMGLIITYDIEIHSIKGVSIFPISK